MQDSGFWRGKRCLVTGGMGFGGSHLCRELLRRGARVHVLDRVHPRSSYLVLSGLAGETEFIQGDVRDLKLVEFILGRCEIETIFHLAAQPAAAAMANSQPLELFSVNAAGTYSVLEAARTCGLNPSVILASGSVYYGAISCPGPIAEEQPAGESSSIYAASKIAADFGVRSYARAYGLRAAVCRFTHVYGPGNDNLSSIVPQAVFKLMEGRPYTFDCRDADSIFDYLHVRDVTRAYLALAENIHRVSGQAFNLGGEGGYSVRELLRLISRIFDREPREPVFSSEQRAPVRKCLGRGRAEKALGWRPLIPLRLGLAETVLWYKRNREAVFGQERTAAAAGETARVEA